MAGGPPVRGEILPFWEPTAALSATEQAAWETAARRIASGLGVLAHLQVTHDPQQVLLAFACGDDPGLAANWVQAIHSENVAARMIVDGGGQVGVALPCRPDFSDEEIRHVVLACVKAAHVDAVPVTAEVAAQLDSLRLAEQVVSDVAQRLRSFGSGLRGLGGRPRH